MSAVSDFPSSIPSALLAATGILPPPPRLPLPLPWERRSLPHQVPVAHSLHTRCLTILPALNEEAGLAVTLEEYSHVKFESTCGSPSVLVVDGHSSDGTLEVAGRWGAECLVQNGAGKGAAIQDGLRWALDHRYDSVAVLDADGTYPCKSLPALFALLEGGSELAVGVRRPERTPTLRDLVHRCGNGLLNFAAAELTRAPILDICSGFWGIRTELLSHLPLESNGFDIEAELFVRAFRRGSPVAQLPIEYRERVGEAKLHAVRDGTRILWAILRHALRADPSVPPRSRRVRESPIREPFSFRTLLMSLGPQRLILLSGPDRAREAEEVASEFARVQPDSEIITAVTSSPDRYLTDPPSAPLPLSMSSSPTAPVYVVLPPRGPSTVHDRGLLVAIPGSGRVYQVPDPSGASRTLAGAIPRESRTGRGFLARLSNLYSFLDASADHQVVRFFDANLAKATPGNPRSARPPRPPSGPQIPTLSWNPIARTFQR
ncbi:MAG: glycosyltransferase family 2 protein [Thermoplasmata archaeon]